MPPPLRTAGQPRGCASKFPPSNSFRRRPAAGVSQKARGSAPRPALRYSVPLAHMDLPLYARRINERTARRAADRAVAVVASAWRTPKQRRLGLALAAAVLSAIAFARIAEDYLTNDPLARWDV